jgi:hypothetical protein
LLDRDTAAFCFQIASHGLRIVVADGQHIAGIVEPGLERGETLVPHQHQEPDFRKIFRVGGIETGRAVLDGIAPVGRERLADAEGRRLKCLGRKAFDRIAIDALEGGGGMIWHP